MRERFAGIPVELKSVKQWCIWQGKTKVPLTPKQTPVSTTDENSWSTFEDCAAVSKDIGYIFKAGSGILGIDLDDCFKSDGQSLKTWAAKVLARIGRGYVEISPSGRGLHILVKAQKPGPRCKKVILNKAGERVGEIELYDSKRYFTMTGNLFDAELCSIDEANAEVASLYDVLFADESKEKGATTGDVGAPQGSVSAFKDNETSAASVASDIVAVILKSAQAQKFKLLVHGPLESVLSAYENDHSRAVFALCSVVAFYTKDPAIMDQIFTGSCLYSDKWAPNPDARGALGKGKWARLGGAQFLRLRAKYEAAGDVYDASRGRTTPGQDFSELGSEERQAAEAEGQADYEKYVNLLYESFIDVRRDLFSGGLFGKGADGKWRYVFNKDIIASLKGECQKREGYKPGRVENYLYLHEQSLVPKLLIDVPAWDGQDRIARMCSLLTFEEPEVTTEVFTDLFKDWCARLWAKIFSPEIIQNRCIILSGAQGVGKDVWIQSMFHGLGHYLSDLTMAGKYTKENEIAVVMGESALVFISEFDKTADMGISSLKDLITKPFFSQVRKYDRGRSMLENRCSMIGACNPDNVLQDATGNRRFLVFRLSGGPREAIRWDFPVRSEEWTMQCLAQCRHLASIAYKATEDSERVMREVSETYTPEDPHVGLVEEFEAAVQRSIDPCSAGDMLGLSEMGSILNDLSKNFALPRRTVLCVLKRAGCQYRTSKSRLYGTREAVKARKIRTLDVLGETLKFN